jgi:SlyX protein
MSDYKISENKIIEIETKLAFAEQSIEELNDVIVNQQKSIDKLNLQIQQLNSKVEEESQHWQTTSPVDETPPHY